MSTSCSRKQAYQQGILLYFNRALLKKGVITDREYTAMKLKIRARDGTVQPSDTR